MGKNGNMEYVWTETYDVSDYTHTVNLCGGEVGEGRFSVPVEVSLPHTADVVSREASGTWHLASGLSEWPLCVGASRGKGPGVWAAWPRSRELAGGVGCGCGERAAAVYGGYAIEGESGGATGGGRWGDWWWGDWWAGCGSTAAAVPGGAEA